MNVVLLPEFQKFLISHKLVTDKYVQFYAVWVHKFLKFSNENKNSSLDEKIEIFLNNLRDSEISQDWQVDQAETALRLYIYQFLKVNKSLVDPNCV
ncbi:hypothetical protein HZA55_04085 [Candidatus Poribacteria bacterium]|nr:hypothetical protein [Candidatus Poribacteria bacterium]